MPWPSTWKSCIPRKTADPEISHIQEAPPLSTNGNPSELIENARTLPTRKIIGAVATIALVVVVSTLIYVGRRSSHKDIVDTETAPPAAEVSASAPVERTTAASPSPSSEPSKVESTKPKESNAVTKPQEKEAAAVAPVVASAATRAASADPSHPTSSMALGTPRAAHELVVEVKHDSWAKVVADDKPPVEKILKAGEKATYSADSKIKLVLGNSDGAQVTHNGEKSEGIKYDGTIHYWVFPPKSHFAQDKRHGKREASSNAGSSESTDKMSDAKKGDGDENLGQ